jgi:hypothetical protein
VAKLKKLWEKAKNNPAGVRHDDLCKLAEAFGFAFKGGKGSHRVYMRDDVSEIMNFQNVGGMAKPYQVRQFIKIVEDNKLKFMEDENVPISD